VEIVGNRTRDRIITHKKRISDAYERDFEMTSEKTVVIQHEALLSTVEALFEKWGFSQKESGLIADVLVAADLSGIDSHGIRRLGMYEGIIAKGIVQVRNQPAVERETSAIALVNANRAMGQLSALFSMDLAVKKAKSQGVGVVVTRDSNHFGIAGYYAERASKQNLLGVCATNSRAAMPATFGSLPLIGTNPIAFAFPNAPYDFLYDASSTVVSVGKIEVCAKKGRKLPIPWGLDRNGNTTTKPGEILDGLASGETGGILPLGGYGEDAGGYKGYGQGLMVEILTAILSGGATSDGISRSKKDGACHFFMVLDPAKFGDVDRMKEQTAAYFERLRRSNVDRGRRVYIHGEKEFEKRERYLREGIPIEADAWAEFEEICRRNEVPLR
jgi:LDH2 family malate/lactate/ureidoglycolate dehydrogenase